LFNYQDIIALENRKLYGILQCEVRTELKLKRSCWRFQGKYPGRRESDQRAVVVETSVGRDLSEAGDRDKDWDRDWYDAERL